MSGNDEYRDLLAESQGIVAAGATCAVCGSSWGRVTGAGTKWADSHPCSAGDGWHPFSDAEIYRRRRAYFLATAEAVDGQHRRRLEFMLEAVTPEVPDLKAVAAEPWPGDKAPAPRKACAIGPAAAVIVPAGITLAWAILLILALAGVLR